ncbi:MAG: hemerythrin family protein [Rhodospirillaceae bacterium]|jgi:hemerythrin-like metal-binding protein|nr:hemerythrin family protein [Rhodospirillaceae bacterium]MBT6136424.1 hemerythrin family protein [Rhodospirillaceae bacterium]
MVTWTEELSVGIDELDDDHKRLIEIINRLETVSGDAEDPEGLRQCIYSLMRYAEYHFAREEKVMAACAYAGLSGHEDEHLAFTLKIREVARRFEVDPEAARVHIAGQLIAFLNSWLIEHIMVNDMAYSPIACESPEARRVAKSVRGSHVWWGS